MENKSLYWHPSIYRVDSNGLHTRVDNLDFGPYYRWDKSVSPVVEPFPPGFRMIAASNDPGADGGDEEDGFVAMFTECCDFVGEEESCNEWEGELFFPKRNCDFLGFALGEYRSIYEFILFSICIIRELLFANTCLMSISHNLVAMPTCWNGENDSVDHKSHMAYTTNGQVNGNCPSTHNRRLPQIQVFVRIPNYSGATYNYILSDGNSIPGRSGAYNFHTDFFNGWDEGKFQEILDNCQPSEEQDGYNPPCDCTPGEETVYDGGLTVNTRVPNTVCDADVKRLIVDEEIGSTNTLPVYARSCQGAPLIPRTWTELTADLFSTDCNDPISTTSTTSSTTSSSTTTSSTTKPPATTSTTSSTSIATSTSSAGCSFPLGRKVKIVSLYGQPLNMFELQVLSPSGDNVSQGKLASQSSDLRSRFAASKAIDGKGRSFSHTGKNDALPWWQVDLGDILEIESIKIVNRWCQNSSDPKGCLCRLSRVAVSITDANGNWVASSLLGNTCNELEVDVSFPCA